MNTKESALLNLKTRVHNLELAVARSFTALVTATATQEMLDTWAAIVSRGYFLAKNSNVQTALLHITDPRKRTQAYEPLVSLLHDAGCVEKVINVVCGCRDCERLPEYRFYGFKGNDRVEISEALAYTSDLMSMACALADSEPGTALTLMALWGALDEGGSFYVTGPKE